MKKVLKIFSYLIVLVYLCAFVYTCFVFDGLMSTIICFGFFIVIAIIPFIFLIDFKKKTINRKTCKTGIILMIIFLLFWAFSAFFLWPRIKASIGNEPCDIITTNEYGQTSSVPCN